MNAHHDPTNDPIEVTSQTVLSALGRGAAQLAQANAFSRYQRGKSQNTLKTQYRALQLWAQFLNDSAEKQGHDAAFSADLFFSNPEGWGSMTWGLVASFYDWLLAQGFALTTAAHRLAHIKQYARLAALELPPFSGQQVVSL